MDKSCHGSLRPRVHELQPGSIPARPTESAMLTDEELTASKALVLLNTDASQARDYGKKDTIPGEVMSGVDRQAELHSSTVKPVTHPPQSLTFHSHPRTQRNRIFH